MKRTIIYLSFVLLIIFQCGFIYSQFSFEEVAERSTWEEFLKTAEIFKSKKKEKGEDLVLY